MVAIPFTEVEEHPSHTGRSDNLVLLEKSTSESVQEIDAETVEFELGFLRDRAFRVIGPILVELREEDGQMTAWVDAFEVWGCGDNMASAVGDLQLAIVDLYEDLEREQSHLTAYRARIFDQLQRVLEVDANYRS